MNEKENQMNHENNRRDRTTGAMCENGTYLSHHNEMIKIRRTTVNPVIEKNVTFN